MSRPRISNIIQKRFKFSAYNYFIKYDKNNYIGYNFLYRSVIRMPAIAYSNITKLLLSGNELVNSELNFAKLQRQWAEALIETHFLIEKDFDELGLIKLRYFSNFYSDNSLSLILLPTMWCNLDCPYCFEYKKSLFMSKEIENKFIEWLELNFKDKRNIRIAWFGGEPLLAKATIIRLTKRIKMFCKKNGATYSASLTTNGFFLDKEFQKVISSLSIKSVQITLDGDEKEHDYLRKQRDGKGSFSRIFNNIIDFCENVKDCKLTLRVNCTDSNFKSIKTLMEKFPSNVKNNSNVYFRWIWQNEASGYKDFACNERGDRPYLGLAKKYHESSTVGWETINPNNKLKSGYCEADELNYYTIDPQGSIFLCTHTFKHEDSIGSVKGGREFINPDKMGKYISWVSNDPFNDKECISCRLLPLCIGGCRRYRIEGKKQCIEEKGAEDLYILNLINEQFLRIKNLNTKSS